MSGLILTLRDSQDSKKHDEPPRASGAPAPRLDLSGVVPDRLLGLDVASISALSVTVDGKLSSIGQQFAIDDRGRSELILKGDFSRCDRVGAAMLDGRMVIHSSVGNNLADGMRGGSLIVHGSAGDYACSNQRGGNVHIDGNVGDYCAGASTGSRRGMRGGTVLVQGDAGRFLGYRMRRGTVVARSARLGLAAYMIAGTIVVSGATEATIADGMRRGTVITLQETAPLLSKGFTAWEPIRLSYLHLLEEHLRSFQPTADWTNIFHRPYSRSLGDRASGGTGEVIWLAP